MDAPEFQYVVHHAEVEGRICPVNGTFVVEGHAVERTTCPVAWGDHVRALQVIEIRAVAPHPGEWAPDPRFT